MEAYTEYVLHTRPRTKECKGEDPWREMSLSSRKSLSIGVAEDKAITLIV